MKKTHPAKRILSLLLVFAMIFALYMPARAASGSEDSKASFKKVDTTVSADLSNRVAETAEEEPAYGPKEKVRVSIVLEDKPTVQAGYAIEGIAQNQAAIAYRDKLEDKQESMAQQISKQALGGAKLDVVWNLTLAANLISANVEYGQIEKIKQVSGVDAVYIEPVYEPDVVSGGSADVNMLPSSHMIGSPIAWESGYTGAGSRIAIIDTGLDTDHQSFDPGALEYALQEYAELPLTNAAHAIPGGGKARGILYILSATATAKNPPCTHFSTPLNFSPTQNPYITPLVIVLIFCFMIFRLRTRFLYVDHRTFLWISDLPAYILTGGFGKEIAVDYRTESLSYPYKE